ncbi:hypothetical protein HOK51_04705 [Candidatus Woesearchaeota archaeon]|jgi:hypothetical protein|nr:hypothetical protein [Candidatus Woesearchaeota archaeon]MBT6519125.1 hypothetical protein [Candidatus Woesearchaeota archaeon]
MTQIVKAQQKYVVSNIGECSPLESLVDEPENINDVSKTKLRQKIKSSSSKYAEKYFRPKSIERWKDGRIYEGLGVHYFKKIVPTGGEYVSKLFNIHPIRNAKTKEEGLRQYEPITRIFESIHTPAVIIMAALAAGFIQTGSFKIAAYGTLINLAINIYPVMLQRYNRARIYNELDKIELEKK